MCEVYLQGESMDGRKKYSRLEDLVEDRGLAKLRAIMRLYDRWCDGSLHIRDEHPPSNLAQYLSRLDYSLWFWTIIILGMSGTVLTIIQAENGVLFYARILLGGMIVLLLPGLVTLEAVYPEEESLSSIARLALSIVISVALTAASGIIADYLLGSYSGWKVAMILMVYTLALSLVAAREKTLMIRSISSESTR